MELFNYILGNKEDLILTEHINKLHACIFGFFVSIDKNIRKEYKKWK